MVYKYHASAKNREEHMDSGTVYARDEADARQKLRGFGYEKIDLKRVTGVSAFFGKYRADVK